jgi:hypothetical protein
MARLTCLVTMKVSSPEPSQEESPFNAPGNCVHSLRNIVIPAFCNTKKVMEQVQQDKIANAKLAMMIKQCSSPAAAKDVQTALLEEPSVQPQNVEADVVARALKISKKQGKTLLKEL